jgi:hypothetical protein
LPQEVSTTADTGTAVSAARCQNCGTALTGPFCSACGQREQSRIVSLGSLLKDAVGDIYHLDSRIWRTLRALLTKPGFLTVEFLAGRRARYLPPFRLYLVVSIVLFLLTQHLRDLDTPVFVRSDPAQVAKLYAATQAALDAKRAELARGGSNERLRGQIDGLSQKLDELRAEQVALSKPGDGCDRLNFSFFGSKALQARTRAACKKIEADKGVGLTRTFIANLPKMMFIFLPILALVNKLLYLRSRRFYVEHLLFFVHLHVFLFLALSAVIVGNGLFAFVPGGVHPPAIVSTAVTLALFAYVYLAMRRVYGQGRFKTFIKFGFLFFAYTISLSITTVFTMLYSALTL